MTTSVNLKRIVLTAVIFIMSLGLLKAQKVYEVSAPVMADITYCVVPNEIMADIVVYKAKSQSNPAIQKNEGVWYFCSAECEAQLNICKVVEPAAQLKVCFTDSQLFAGWKNESKRELMKASQSL